MAEFDAEARFAAAAVARLATVAADGQPHLVPVVFALADGVIYTAIDGKPKSTTQLRRLANIEANPHVSMLVDHYSDDWSQLWWVRADGIASIHLDGSQFQCGSTELRAKYPQYQSVPLNGPVIAISVEHWQFWAASPVTPMTRPAARPQPDNPQ